MSNFRITTMMINALMLSRNSVPLISITHTVLIRAVRLNQRVEQARIFFRHFIAAKEIFSSIMPLLLNKTATKSVLIPWL